MQYSIINYRGLERTARLDGEFYQPIFLDLFQSLNTVNTEPITNLCKISDGNHMTVAEYFQENEGLPYYRGQDINTNFFLEDAKPVYIPRKIYDRGYMKRSHFRIGDVLLSIVGTVGSLSMITDKISESTGSCKLAILRPLKISPEYLSAFLMSRYGNLQIKRNTRGAVQTGLLLEDMDQIRIFIPNKSFEIKIITLVKSSILKNRFSKSLYFQAEQTLLSELGLLDWKPKHRLSFVKKFSDTDTAGRIDAEYFQPMYEEVVKSIGSLKNHAILDDIVSIKKCVEPGSEAYQDSGIPFLRVSNLSKYGINNDNQQFISEALYDTFKTHQPKKGEILLSKDATPGIAYYLKDTPSKMIPSGGILRLTVKDTDQVYSEYLTLVLNSIVVQKQIERDAGGSIINHWLVDQVKNTLIPVLPVSKQRQITESIQQSFSNREQSKRLLNIAKLGVEMAIEKREKNAQDWIEAELAALSS